MNSCEHFVCSNIVQLSLINHYFMLLPPVGLPTLLESFLRALSLVCPVERQFQFLLWLCCLCCVLGGALVPPSLTERKEFDRKKTGVKMKSTSLQFSIQVNVDPFSMNIQQEFWFLNQKPYSISTKNCLWNCKLNYENSTDTTLQFFQRAKNKIFFPSP